jgi:hypothetical protein
MSKNHKIPFLIKYKITLNIHKSSQLWYSNLLRFFFRRKSRVVLHISTYLCIFQRPFTRAHTNRYCFAIIHGFFGAFLAYILVYIFSSFRTSSSSSFWTSRSFWIFSSINITFSILYNYLLLLSFIS